MDEGRSLGALLELLPPPLMPAEVPGGWEEAEVALGVRFAEGFAGFLVDVLTGRSQLPIFLGERAWRLDLVFTPTSERS